MYIHLYMYMYTYTYMYIVNNELLWAELEHTILCSVEIKGKAWQMPQPEQLSMSAIPKCGSSPGKVEHLSRVQ